MNTELVKGFRDYTSEEASKRETIRKIVVENFEKYGFEPSETPIVEYEEFVKGDNEKDEAVSDIFKLQDKGKRKLALRYERTFQLKRIMNNKKLPYKSYQIGAVFRDEPVSGNRVRQFMSCDVDIIGSSVKDDAEILSLAKNILDKLKVKYTIYVNNRKLINEVLDELKVKNKADVMREIDKLDKLPEKEVQQNLKKYNAEKVLNIFKKEEKYFEKYKAYEEIKELKKYCSYYKTKIVFLPSLMRGLGYYNGTIFEIKSDIRETIIGGGSFTFNGIKSVGFGVSLERLSAVSNIKSEKEKTLIISLNEDKKAVEIANKLRDKGENVSIFYGKPSKALEFANSYNYNKVIFVGEKEVKSGKYKVKDMGSGKETLGKM
ncbi:histidine--tRNA ligase [Candidatus Pacearchaeota archaeon]|nr:histidine--tRNA ligase [Candidatus Pacearchaeota archaeon]